MDVTSRVNDIEFKNHDHEFKSEECICKENYELRSKIEDIIDEFQKHVTSSEVHFGVIEQLFEDHETTSDNRFGIIEQIVEEHVTTSDNHFAEVKQNLRNHIGNSDSHFRQVDTSLGEITTNIQV